MKWKGKNLFSPISIITSRFIFSYSLNSLCEARGMRAARRSWSVFHAQICIFESTKNRTDVVPGNAFFFFFHLPSCVKPTHARTHVAPVEHAEVLGFCTCQDDRCCLQASTTTGKNNVWFKKIEGITQQCKAWESVWAFFFKSKTTTQTYYLDLKKNQLSGSDRSGKDFFGNQPTTAAPPCQTCWILASFVAGIIFFLNKKKRNSWYPHIFKKNKTREQIPNSFK